MRVPGKLTATPTNLSRTSISARAQDYRIAAILQQPEHIVLLIIATQMQKSDTSIRF